MESKEHLGTLVENCSQAHAAACAVLHSTTLCESKPSSFPDVVGPKPVIGTNSLYLGAVDLTCTTDRERGRTGSCDAGFWP